LCYVNSVDARRRGRGRPRREGGPKDSRSVRLDDDLWRDLGRIARAHELTVSQVIEANLLGLREDYRRLFAVWAGGTADLPGFEGWRIDLPPSDFPGLLPDLVSPDGRRAVSLSWAIATMSAGSKSPAEALAKTAAALSGR
jgi:hypothetical protein